MLCLEEIFVESHAVSAMVAGPPQGLTDKPCKLLTGALFRKGRVLNE
jgi:hypothetical protein